MWETIVDFDICSVIAKIALRDVDILFEDQNLQMLISMKSWELAQNWTEWLSVNT